MSCLQPYSRRITDMASVMKELRGMETVYCPRSDDIQDVPICPIEEEELERYKLLVSSTVFLP